MENVWFLASIWVGLALVATLFAIWLKISTALSEIVVGTVAQLIVGVAIGRGSLGGSSEWVTFLAGTGAILAAVSRPRESPARETRAATPIAAGRSGSGFVDTFGAPADADERRGKRIELTQAAGTSAVAQACAALVRRISPDRAAHRFIRSDMELAIDAAAFAITYGIEADAQRARQRLWTIAPGAPWHLHHDVQALLQVPAGDKRGA